MLKEQKKHFFLVTIDVIEEVTIIRFIDMNMRVIIAKIYYVRNPAHHKIHDI